MAKTTLAAALILLLCPCARGALLHHRLIQPKAWSPQAEYLSGTYRHKAMYMADITVGSQGQTFRVLVDTGSSQLVLPSETCGDSACQKHRRLSVHQSTTATKTAQTMMIGFGSGSVSGRIFQDGVCLPVNGRTAHLVTEASFLQESTDACARMDFLLADKESGSFENDPFDGILGLGTDSDNPLLGRPEYSFLRQLVSAGKLDSTTFTLHLGDNDDSELTLGGVDESHLAGGQLSWWNLSPASDGHWQFPVCDLTLDGVPQHFGRIDVGVDSGTSLLAADDSLKGWLEEHLGASEGCNSVDHRPKLGLRRHDGSTLLLLPSDYVDKIDGECSLALMPNYRRNNGQRLLLGASFLRRYVAVFDRDNSRLGFGVSAGDQHAPQLLEALFPQGAQGNSECEDHELNTALSGLGDLGDLGSDFDAQIKTTLREERAKSPPALVQLRGAKQHQQKA